jgi:hypothetical protein
MSLMVDIGEGVDLAVVNHDFYFLFHHKMDAQRSVVSAA